MSQTIATHTPANPRLRRHGFENIHGADIRRDRGSRYRLDVTGTRRPIIKPGAPVQIVMTVKTIATGTRESLADFARANNLAPTL